MNNKQRYVDRLLKQKKQLNREIEDVAPSIYAAVALALHRRYGWGVKSISKVFEDSQLIWDECVATGDNMLDMCERETGIVLVNNHGQRYNEVTGGNK